MEKISPSPEAKALSLFFMAFKAKSPIYKEKSKRINKLWDLVKAGKLKDEHYIIELNSLLEDYGGYDAVVEKTVKFYIDTTGAWKSNGEDKYSQDAKAVADKLLAK